MSGDDTGKIEIISCRGGPDPACELRWDGRRWYAPVADVRTTAIDLVTCAAYAEMMMTMITELDLPGTVVARFTTGLLAGAGRVMFGTPATLDLLPAGSSTRREAVVVVRRGDRAGEWQGVLSPAEARDMALGWLVAAEATESDHMVARALRDVTAVTEEDAEALFVHLREMRAAP